MEMQLWQLLALPSLPLVLSVSDRRFNWRVSPEELRQPRADVTPCLAGLTNSAMADCEIPDPTIPDNSSRERGRGSHTFVGVPWSTDVAIP
jgi:hypothetical protein